jgi:hypothetical protein
LAIAEYWLTLVRIRGDRITELIEKTQGKQTPLSQCMAEALSIARKLGNKELETFCRREIKGWDTENFKTEKPQYRQQAVFLSIGAQVNVRSYFWGGKVSNLFKYMQAAWR